MRQDVVGGGAERGDGELVSGVELPGRGGLDDESGRRGRKIVGKLYKGLALVGERARIDGVVEGEVDRDLAGEGFDFRQDGVGSEEGEGCLRVGSGDGGRSLRRNYS